ncbi:MAG: hypothetical protein WCO77_03450 [bacterium]
MKKSSLLSLIALVPCLLAGAVNPEHFKFDRILEGSAPIRTEAVAALLDEAMHRTAADRYADVRIVDDRGMEIPCAIEKVLVDETRVVRRPVVSRATALKELPGNRIEAEFELDRPEYRADGFDVVTPLRDFARAVSVFGSRDGRVWEPLVQNADICDYSRYLDVRRTEVVLPAGSGPRFRVEIGNASEDRVQPLVKLVSQQGGQDAGAEIRTQELLRTPFRMDGIGFWRNETVVEARREARREWDLPAPAVVENSKEKTTEITVDAGRLPLSRLVLVSAFRNFSRVARVQIQVTENGVARWRNLAEARVRNVDLPGFVRSELEIDFPEQRVMQLRVTVSNGDNPPLSEVRLRGFGPVYRVLMLAEPGRTYRLLYGSENLPAPVYDLEAVLTPVRQGLQPKVRTLGPVHENPAYQPARAGLGDWLNNKAFMTGAIILAALVLLIVLARSLKSVKKIED